jgi:hypothetical protein
MICDAGLLGQLPGGLRIPVAARSVVALEQGLGALRPIPGFALEDALLVRSDYLRPFRDPSRRIWRHRRSYVLDPEWQVWAHTDFDKYRPAYRAARPHEDPRGLDVDHVVSRTIARETGYRYVRLEAISSETNGSAGGNERGIRRELPGARGRALVRQTSAAEPPPFAATQSIFDIALAGTLEIAKMLDIPPGRKTRDGSGGHTGYQEVCWQLFGSHE